MSGNGVVLGEIKVSKICSHKKHGTWWAIGTEKEYLELRITKTGKIKPFTVQKKSHPYFTLDQQEGASYIWTVLKS